jgi:hypothetical protein
MGAKNRDHRFQRINGWIRFIRLHLPVSQPSPTVVSLATVVDFKYK